jgi:hypothetical protein
MIGTIISALLPILSVVVLYCVKNMWVRLGLVAMFTVLFSLVLSLIAPAKRIEVFAATAAFVLFYLLKSDLLTCPSGSLVCRLCLLEVLRFRKSLPLNTRDLVSPPYSK